MLVKFNVDHYEFNVDESQAKANKLLLNYSLVGGWYLPKLYLEALDTLALTNNTTIAGSTLGGAVITKSVYGKNVFKVNDYIFNLSGLPVKKQTLKPNLFTGGISGNFINIPKQTHLQIGDKIELVTLKDVFIYKVGDSETKVFQW